jgi:hypothetical protein
MRLPLARHEPVPAESRPRAVARARAGDDDIAGARFFPGSYPPARRYQPLTRGLPADYCFGEAPS